MRRVEHRQVVLVAKRHVQIHEARLDRRRRCSREPDGRSKIRPPSTLTIGAARLGESSSELARPCRRVDRTCSASSPPAPGRCPRRAAASGSPAPRPCASRSATRSSKLCVKLPTSMSRPNRRPASWSGKPACTASCGSRVCGRSSGRNAEVVDRLEVLRAQHRQPMLREVREAGRAVEIADARALRARGRSPRTSRCRRRSPRRCRAAA